jgi:cell wall-associated NlpC family hydrolase
MPAISRMRSLFVLPIMLAAILSAMFVTSTPRAEAMTTSQRIGTAVGVAVNQIGDPYRYGAAGPNSFDCSGLVYYSYRKAGFSRIPRTSSAQARFARPIAKRNMRRGDLMFFTNGGGVYHAAIFLRWDHGRAWMLDAPRSGERVHAHFAWTTSWVGRTLR